MYDTQNQWVSGLCPSSGILNNYTHRFGNYTEAQKRVQKQGILLANWQKTGSLHMAGK
jgi:hypothetical protein